MTAWPGPLTKAVNAALDAARADVGDWYLYGQALGRAETALGSAALTEAERDMIAAYQLDTCIESSGLFSYFELQPEAAAHGSRAMQRLGAPRLADMLRRSLRAMNLPADADAATINRATRDMSGKKFERLLDDFEHLERAVSDGPERLDKLVHAYLVVQGDALRRAEPSVT